MPGIPSNSVNVGALIASLGLDTTAFQAGLAGANTKMSATSAKMAAMGAKMQKAGKAMTMGLTLPIIAMGVAAINAQSKFEASMSKIVGLVGVAEDQVKKWEKAILKIGPAVGKGPEELADAMFFIASAGIRGAEAMEVLEMSAKASASGLGETKLVADLVTSAMNAYGSANLSAAQATDILVATVREGKAEATDLAGAMGMVLPIASEMGVTFDQVGAAFAGMTRTGTNARVAATQLKAILSKLLDPTDMAEKALIGMGTSSTELRRSIKEDGLITTLETLRKTTNKYGEDTMAKVFPNIRALMGVLDLMGKNMEENIAISDRMADSTGSLDAAYLAATKTTRFKWARAMVQIQTAFTKFGIALKSSIVPIIEKLTDKIKTITDKFDNMTAAQKESTIKLLAMTAAVGPLLMLMGKLFKLIATNPYIVLAAGIVLVISKIILMTRAHRSLLEGYNAVETASKKINEQYAEQAGKVKLLQARIEDENASNNTRITAINELKKIMPGYTGLLSDEGTLLKHNTLEIEKYLTKLKQKIRLSIFEDEYTEALTRQVRAQRELNLANTKIEDAKRAWEAAGKPMFQYQSVGGHLVKTMHILKAAISVANDELKVSQTDFDNTAKSVKGLEAEMDNLDFTLGGAGTGGTDPDPDPDPDPSGGTITLEEGTLSKRLALLRATAIAEISITRDKYTKLALLEDNAFKNRVEDLEAQKVLYPSLTAEIDALIEAERRAHENRLLIISEESSAAQILAYNKLTKAALLPMIQAYKELTAVAQNWSNAGSSIISVFDGIGRAVQNSNSQLAAWLTYIGNAIGASAQLIGVIMKIAAAKKAEALGNAIASASAYPFPMNLLAIGASVAAVVAAFASIPKTPELAAGGIAYGETLATVGEYSGARSNPEVIAPLSQLKGMLGNEGGGGLEVIETEIRGSDIHLILQRYNNTLMRSGRG